jgi:phosphoribosyl 1,2-cyclic phosphate phosphodiesterase
MGLADIRAYNFNQKKLIDIYASENTIDRIKQSFSYIFNAPEEFKKYYPQVEINEIHGNFYVGGLEFRPFTVFHGKMPVLAFRFENVAYITDVNHMPEENFAYLRDLDILVLEAFRLTKHISHFSLDESISIAKRIGAQQTFFTHIGHDIDHEKIEAALPEGINLAFDGLKISPQK